ncbi:MAG TPA: CPBP family intramembrane glutamic endopeptidase [Myxococcales bacterium]
MIKRRPVYSYLAVTCAWSFGWWSLILTVVPVGALFKGTPNPKAIVFMVLGAAGPAIASLLTTAAIDGRVGLRRLFGRLGRWRIGRWWLLALAPWLMNVVAAGAYLACGGELSGSALLGKLGPAVGLGVMASLFEEPGWRGFLLPRLRERYRPFASALLVGLVWGGLWHGYADWIGLGDLGWRCVPLIVLLGPVLLTAHSYMLSHLHEKTGGSLLACVGYHFSISSSGFIFGLEHACYAQNLVWTSVTVAIAWAVAVGVVVASWRWPKVDA